MRLIDADELWKKINSVTYYGCSPEVKRIRGLIEDAPTVNAKPVRHGTWEDITDGYFATCSACGDRWGSIAVMKYCPGCGAKMDADRKEE